MGDKKKPKLEQLKQEYLQNLRTGQRYSIEKFDEQVLLISSGALVLSLNFIGEVVKLNQAVWRWLLYTSWWLLAGTMIVSVVTHLISYNQHEKQIKRVENDEPLPDDKFTIRWNYFMAFALVLGIALQIIFVTLNSTRMANEKTKPNEIKRDSINVPKDSSMSVRKGLPASSASLKLKVGTFSLPVQSAPKDIKAQINTTPSSAKKK